MRACVCSAHCMLAYAVLTVCLRMQCSLYACVCSAHCMDPVQYLVTLTGTLVTGACIAATHVFDLLCNGLGKKIMSLQAISQSR